MNSFWIILLCGIMDNFVKRKSGEWYFQEYSTCFKSLVSAHASPTCTEDALQICNDLRVHDELDISFPKDEQELKSQCSSEKVPLFCYADFVERCPTFVTKPVRDFYVESRKLFNRICDDNGDLQSKYLRNAVCISDIMTNKQEECVEENQDKEEDGVCVYQTAIVRCLGSLVADHCGEEALDVMREVYRVMKPMIDNGACDDQ